MDITEKDIEKLRAKVAQAKAIEREAEDRAIAADLGVGEWPAFAGEPYMERCSDILRHADSLLTLAEKAMREREHITKFLWGFAESIEGGERQNGEPALTMTPAELLRTLASAIHDGSYAAATEGKGAER